MYVSNLSAFNNKDDGYSLSKDINFFTFYTMLQ